jgi:hypothetical protein
MSRFSVSGTKRRIIYKLKYLIFCHSDEGRICSFSEAGADASSLSMTNINTTLLSLGLS